MTLPTAAGITEATAETPTNETVEELLGSLTTNEGTPFFGSSPTMKNLISSLRACRNARQAVIVWGPPGVGKTALVNAIAQEAELKLHTLIASSMDPSDVEGLPALKQVALPDGTTATVTDNTLPFWAQDFIERGDGALFLDEFSNADPAMQAAMLSPVQDRRVGRHPLPKNLWIVAAANPTDQAANGWALSLPASNRFTHIYYTPDVEDFFEGMTASWNEVNPSGRLIEERLRIVGFLKDNPMLALKPPTPGEIANGDDGWPSWRTWDALARLLANVTDGSAGVRRDLIRGTVGLAAGNAFQAWEDALRLPSFEDFLNRPEGIEWNNLNSAEVYMVVTSAIARMNDADTNDKVLNSLLHIKTNSTRHNDIVANQVTSFIRKTGTIEMSGPERARRIFLLAKNFTSVWASAEVR